MGARPGVTDGYDGRRPTSWSRHHDTSRHHATSIITQMEMPQPLASARGIRVAFGGNEVLHGVDLDLLPGEIHAITGENGAGKSTLARVMAGIYRPSGGHVEIGGQPTTFRSAS